MLFIHNILDFYSWQGVALIAILLILFLVQFYYYAIAYRRIYRYRLMRTHKAFRKDPPVSVIVVARGENEDFLFKELPSLLAQDYPLYEVVVVYVGGDMEYYGELQIIENNTPHMHLTRMGGNERIYITTKQALNVGIKRAQYECLLFTTPGAMPRTEEWVATMARGFERGSVVLAPAVATFETATTKTYFMRLTELYRASNAMALAVQGKMYWAPRSNFGFTRSLYDSTRGFDHLNLDLGENDLYLQSIATSKNTAVVMTPNAIVNEVRNDDWAEWVDIMRFNDYTKLYYPSHIGTFQRWERGSRMLFLLVALVAMVVLPLELKLLAALLVLLRYIVVLHVVRRVARKLGERGIAWRYWMFDLVGPLIERHIATHRSQKCTTAWR